VASATHTFLFADLVGYTALTASEGDDRAVEIAVEMHRRVRELLPEHCSDEVKTIGDAVMLHCEDPGHAIRLGVRIVSELERVPGFPPVRVGIHTGPAIDRDGDWYGATVNVAARLCAAAGGGQVLVSDATCERAGNLRWIDLAEQELHWLKNVTEPVPARLAAERDLRAEALARVRRAKLAAVPRFMCPHHRSARAQEALL
jgi:adenylate cyclase